MQWSAMEWIDGMQCSGVEWNGVDGCSGWMIRTPNVHEQFDLGFSALPTTSIFRKWLICFFLRGAFENGLEKKACHKISIFEKCVFTAVFKRF